MRGMSNSEDRERENFLKLTQSVLCFKTLQEQTVLKEPQMSDKYLLNAVENCYQNTDHRHEFIRRIGDPIDPDKTAWVYRHVDRSSVEEFRTNQYEVDRDWLGPNHHRDWVYER